MGSSKETGVRPASGPLYKQLVKKLKARILSGNYPPGSQLPTEIELAELFAVSRHTVRAALRQLRDDGLVSSKQGSGSTVLRPGATQTYVHEISSIGDLINYAAGMRFEIESLGMIECTPEQAQKLECGIGQRWLQILGFRYLEGNEAPICWTEVFVHDEYAGVARLLERNRGPIYEMVEDLYGERIEEVEQIVQSGQTPAHIASALSMEPHSTVLEVQRRYRLASGKLAIIAFNLHKPEMFRLSFSLRKSKTQS